MNYREAHAAHLLWKYFGITPLDAADMDDRTRYYLVEGARQIIAKEQRGGETYCTS